MERFLGALEHSFWLYDQLHPVHFALRATISGKFSLEQLQQSLAQAQRRHPLLRVSIGVEASGRPKFIEQVAPIPIRVLPRLHDAQANRELEIELSQSFDWSTAPLVRVVWLRSAQVSELIVTCHHSIADGLSVAYLLQQIIAGLENPTAQTVALSEAVALEPLVPGLTEAAAQQPTPIASTDPIAPTYRTVPSQRNLPHIRTALLTATLTRQLIVLCRQEQTSLHGLISAAFLMALAQQRQASATELRCLSPINLRAELTANVGEAVGLYIHFGLTTHQVQADTQLWELSRSLKAQLLAGADLAARRQHILMRQLTMATLPKAEIVAMGMQQQFGYDLLVSNLGQLNFAQQYGALRLEALYGPAVMTAMIDGRVVGVATVGDQLSLTLLASSVTTSDAETESLLAAALDILQTLGTLAPALSKTEEQLAIAC
jgi:hypothetical protein